MSVSCGWETNTQSTDIVVYMRQITHSWWKKMHINQHLGTNGKTHTHIHLCIYEETNKKMGFSKNKMFLVEFMITSDCQQS